MPSNNKSNLLSTQDFGIKISRPGYDATTSSDKDLLFSSSWPSVQIVKVINGTYTKYPHGLGFPPFTNNGSPVDEINVYDVSGTTIVYNIDLTKDVEYPFSNKTSIANNYDYDYGIKMVKEGKDIDSEYMRDYILHSRCVSPMVLVVKTQETSSLDSPDWVQYTNSIGYKTLNFGYVRLTTNNTYGSIDYEGQQKYYPAPFQSQAYPRAFTNGITSSVQFKDAFLTDGATILVLRNPAIALTNSVSVTY